jgi:hypothetical protein
MHRALIFSIFVLGFVGCFGADCVNDVREELSSPNGKMKVVVFSRNCGATTDFNTQASVLRKEEKLPDKAGNAFIIDKGAADVSWRKDGSVLVVLERGARVFKKETSVGGVPIEYRDEN